MGNMQNIEIILIVRKGAAMIVWLLGRWKRWYRRSIKAAARKTYETVGDKAIEGVVPSGGDFVAARETCIVIHAAMGGIQLSGVELPSTRQKPIPPKFCEAENLEWDGSGNVRLTQSENGHGYCKITITAPDLKKHIAWVRGGMKDIEGAANPAAA